MLALSIRIECLARDLGRTYLVSLSFLLASSQFIWDEIAEAKCHFGPTLDFASVISSQRNWAETNGNWDETIIGWAQVPWAEMKGGRNEGDSI